MGNRNLKIGIIVAVVIGFVIGFAGPNHRLLRAVGFSAACTSNC